MANRMISEESDEEFQEIQHTRLQQAYRHAREDQREVNIEKKDQLRTQKKLLEELIKERDELDKAFRLVQSMENQKRDDEKTKKLNELLQIKDTILIDIQEEKDKSTDLDQKLREYEKKIRLKKIQLAGAGGAEFHANVLKQERVLENRLDTTLKRFNALLASNGSLREEIDTLRNERERFENLFQKSEKELKNLRSGLVESIEQSITAFEQRKDANAKAILLHNKAENDKFTSEAEMKELERQVSHDRKLREFMKLKAQERQEDEELVAYRKRKETELNDKRRREREEHSVEAYESKFKQIEEISKEKNLEKLVEKFIEVEDTNFALFNYVNELNSQCELYQEEIAEIRRDIERFEEQGIELAEQRKQKLEQIQDKQTQAVALTKEYEEKTRSTRKSLDQCRTGIDSVFKKIGCDRSQIDHLLQSHEGVTEENMLKYLGIIEERTNELLMAQAAIQAKEQNLSIRDRAPNLIGDGPAPPAPHVQVHLPNTDDRRDPDDDRPDDELKPLTRDELQQRAMDHVKVLERKALQEQSKYNDQMPTPTTLREKTMTGAPSRTGGETGKTPPARHR